MKTSAGFWLLAVLLVAATSFSQAQAVERYFKVGDTLQLSPQPVSAQITSILWKYDENLLADWEKGLIDLTYYSKFKGRTTLNTDTGVLEIRDMTAEDSGVYSVEINNQVQSQVYQIVEIEAVPQPVVEVRPLSCSSASDKCKLVCEGDVNKAGPVEYFWKKDDGEWEKSETNTTEIINDEETKRVETFSCRIKNPVQSRVYKTVAMEDVPQPVVSVRPLVCNSTSKSCTLSCDGDVSNAGPVEYFWKIGDGEWKQSGTNMEIISDEETQHVTNFTCRMKNPVSERDSKPLPNPLFQIPSFPSSSSPTTVSDDTESEAPVILGVVIGSLATVVAFCL